MKRQRRKLEMYQLTIIKVMVAGGQQYTSLKTLEKLVF